MSNEELLILILKYFKEKPKKRSQMSDSNKFDGIEARQLTLVISDARNLGLLEKYMGETNDTVYLTTPRGEAILEKEK